MLEKAIIGYVLIHPSKVDVLLDSCKTKYFNEQENRNIYNQIEEMYNKTGNIEPFALDVDVEKLEETLEAGTNIIILETAIKELKERYKAKLLNKNLEKIITKPSTTEEKINEVLQLVERTNEENTEKNKLCHIKNLVNDWYTRENVLNGVNANFKNLREYIAYEAGNLIVVGARPAMGKTAFGLTIAKDIAKEHDALYINLEMSEDQIVTRLIASEANINLFRLMKKESFEEERIYANFAAQTIIDSKLMILDVIDNDFDVIVRRIRKAHEKNQFKVIVIDYLTLMHAKNHANRNLEVEYMSNKLKALAKELNTCIFVLAQLSRSVEQRVNKRPMLSDLRDSGAIEQAANCVLFLYREDYYSNIENENSLLEVIIAKNRSGQTGSAYYVYKKTTQSIKELSKEQIEEMKTRQKQILGSEEEE